MLVKVTRFPLNRLSGSHFGQILTKKPLIVFNPSLDAKGLINNVYLFLVLLSEGFTYVLELETSVVREDRDEGEQDFVQDFYLFDD